MPALRPIRSVFPSAACLLLVAASLSASSGFSVPPTAAEIPALGEPLRYNPPRGDDDGLPPSFGPYRETGSPVAGQEPETAKAELPVAGLPDQVLAFYGKPGAPTMGILGEYPKDKLATLLDGYARLYDAANGERGVVPAFYIIFGTCWPEGEIGYTKASVIEEYISFAAERGWLVFLDHQIGRYTVDEAVETLLPWLRFPNVHLALDPEWRTLKPMKEIGSITGEEFNRAQARIDDHLRLNGLPGPRMLVVHQFKPRMILERETVRSDYPRVVPVHTADGFGAPALKRVAYRYNAEATNMPVKGFKLFFESKVPGAGWDSPLMRPEDVMTLDPVPVVVMYQ